MHRHLRAIPVPVDHHRPADRKLSRRAGRSRTRWVGEIEQSDVASRHGHTDRQRPALGIHRRPRAEGHRMRGRGRLGQPVDVVDVDAECSLEGVDGARRDGRTTAVAPGQA